MAIMTEEQARGKLCPAMSMSVRGIDAASFEPICCSASDCMAWRWGAPEAPRAEDRRGFCGFMLEPRFD